MLEVRDLQLTFETPAAPVRALRGVNFSVKRGEIFALVGESGSGKTLTGLSLLRLAGETAQVTGQIVFDGTPVLNLEGEELRAFRGRRIAMIFQEPMTALNPVFTIGFQIIEVLRAHGLYVGTEKERALDLLRKVGMSEPEARLRAYPFQLSGGMQQRALIAMALAGESDLLVADEPTTALDVTIQAQILNLLREIVRTTGKSLLLISHDLGVVSQVADRVGVMYAGRIVESGPVEKVLSKPKHPYTRGLIASIPARGRLKPIAGTVPSLADMPSGCAFHPRCPDAVARCSAEAPPVRQKHERSWECVHE